MKGLIGAYVCLWLIGFTIACGILSGLKLFGVI